MMKETTSYKTLSGKLDEILAKLQSPDVDIDEALKLYKDGQKTIEQIEKYLQTAQNKLKVIKAEK